MLVQKPRRTITYPHYSTESPPPSTTSAAQAPRFRCRRNLKIYKNRVDKISRDKKTHVATLIVASREARGTAGIHVKLVWPCLFRSAYSPS